MFMPLAAIMQCHLMQKAGFCKNDGLCRYYYYYYFVAFRIQDKQLLSAELCSCRSCAVVDVKMLLV